MKTNPNLIRSTRRISLILIIGLIILSLSCSRSNNPQIKLKEFSTKAFEVPADYNCDTCILISESKSHDFLIKIQSSDNCSESIGSIKIINDTLFLVSGTKPDRVETIIEFNDISKKYDTTHTSYFSIKEGSSHCLGIYSYIISGLSKIPNCIIHNNKIIGFCDLEKVSYQLKGIDTINYTDRFGLKQGIWVEFFPNTEIICKEETYINGILKQGYEFNRLGDTISRKWSQGSYNLEMHYSN